VREPELRADDGCSEWNFESCNRDLKRRKGADADQPHRIAQWKLVPA
jgi:hypothetical protein